MKRKLVCALFQSILFGRILHWGLIAAESQEDRVVTEAFDFALVERLASNYPELSAPVEATPVANEPLVQTSGAFVI